MTTPMRISVLLLLGLSSACMAPPVEADYEAAEIDGRVAELALERAAIPDDDGDVVDALASLRPRAEAPRLRLAPHVPGDGGCEHDVVAEGFPAVRFDGGAVAIVDRDDGGNADFVGELAIELRRPDDVQLSRSVVFDGEAIYEATEHTWGRACRDAREQIAQRIAAINDELAVGWRPMEALPLQAYWQHGSGPELPALEQLPEPARRPAEALYHGGHFIVRVRGVEVLQSTRMPDWRGEEPEMTLDRTDPAVVGVYVDDATGVALAELSYESASCMSDTRVYARGVALAPGVAAKIRARADFRVDDFEE